MTDGKKTGESAQSGDDELKKKVSELEKSIRDSELLDYQLFDNLPIGYYRTTSDGKILMANASIIRMLGYRDFNEVANINLEQKENVSYSRPAFREQLERDGELRGLEAVWKKRDGSLIHIRENARVVRDSAGKVLYYEGTAEDITYSKMAEHEMKQAKERLQKVFDSVGDAVLVTDLEFKILDCNYSSERIFGYRRDELIGKKIRAFFPKTTPATDAPREWLEKVKSQGVTEGDPELHRRDGSKFPAHLTASVITTSGDQPEGIVLTIRDTSRATRTERELKQRSDLEHQISRLSTEFVNLKPGEIDTATNRALAQIGNMAEVDRSYVFLFSQDGQKMDNTHEWAADKIKPFKESLQGIPLDTFPWLMRRLRRLETVDIPKVTALGSDARAEKEEFLKEDIQSILLIPMIYRRAPIGFVGFDSVKRERTWGEDAVLALRMLADTLTNALQRKRAEEELQEKQRALTTLMGNLPGMAYRCLNDEHWTMEFVSEGCRELTGYESADLIQNRKISYMDINHPEDRGKGKSSIEKSLSARVPFQLTYRIITASGKEKWVWEKGRGIFSTDGKLIALEGFITDITERKRAEVSLTETEQKYRLLADNVTDVIWMIGLDGKLSYVSPSVYSLRGYTAREVLKQEWAEMLSPSSLKEFTADFAELVRMARSGLLASEQPKTKALEFTRNDGTTVWTENIASVMWSPDEKILGFIGVSRDITDRRQAETALRESEEKFRNLAEQSPNMIFINKGNRVVFANLMCETVMGYTREEFYSANFDFNDITAPEYRELVREMFKRHQAGLDVAPYEYALLTRDGKRHTTVLTSKLISYDGGQAILGIITDITERKQAEIALRESERKYRDVVDNMSDGLYVLDTQGYFSFVNKAIVDRSGIPPDKWEKINYQDIILPEYHEATKKNFDLVMAGQTSKPFVVKYRTNRGKDLVVEISTKPIYLAGKFTGLLGISRDITENEELAQAVQASQAYIQSIFKAAPVGIGVVEKRVIRQVNEGLTKMTGYGADELIGKSARVLYLADEDFEYVGREEYRQAREKGSGAVETRWKRRDGSIIDILLSSTPVRPGDTDGPVTFTAQDITEIKSSRQALVRERGLMEKIIETSPAGILMVDLEGTVTYANPQTEKILGVARARLMKISVIDPAWKMCTQDGKPMELNDRPFQKVLRTHKSVMHTLCSLQRPDTKQISLALNAAPLFDAGGKLDGVVFSIEDITEDIARENAIFSSLREKEVLLREIHHRVKNNMQVIYSLLSLQANATKSAKVSAAFRESQTRVRSMALIHERLYKSKSLSEIDFADYIRTLAGELMAAYSVKQNTVKLKIEMETVCLGISSAIPCGLIINEMVSNSLKHAFPGGRKGTINIRWKSFDGGRHQFSVSDDGVGFPEDTDYRKTDSLGMQLVGTLTEQLSGKLNLDRKKGTNFTVSFTENDKDSVK